MEEMRRKDREVTELETVKEIIRQCDVLRLGLADGDYPYIVPMNFGWEEKEGRLYFYLHGAAEGRKAELLRQNGACSFQMDCGHRGVFLRWASTCPHGDTAAGVGRKGSRGAPGFPAGGTGTGPPAGLSAG